MGGCTSKPKTIEYEGLMDPHSTGHGLSGRNSMDADNGSVDVARQSEDSGLKIIGKANSAQKGCERSLQNLFVKQQERGDENLEVNNETTLRDVLTSIGDPKKHTIAGLNPEKHMVKTEERKSDLIGNDGFLCSGEEATVTKSPGKLEATDPGLKNAQEKLALAGRFHDHPTNDLSSLSSKKAEDVDKECAVTTETGSQEKDGRIWSEPQGISRESVVVSETLLPSKDRSLRSEESVEQSETSDLGVEVVKLVDSGQTEEGTSGSDTITLSEASEVAQATVVTHAPADSDGPLEMKAEAFDKRKAAATEEIPCEGVAKVPESEESERTEEKLGWESSEGACLVEGIDLPNEYVTSREPDLSTCSVESPLDVSIEKFSNAEVGTEAFGSYRPSTELNSANSLDNCAAASETHNQSCPTKELEGNDRGSGVPSDFTELAEPYRTEAVDKRRDAEDCTESSPGIQGSLPVNSSKGIEAESADCFVQDKSMIQMSIVSELQPGLAAPDENAGKSPISQVGTPPSASVEGVVSDINACELSAENYSEENSLSLRENPKAYSIKESGSESPQQVKSGNVVTETDSTDWEPAPSQESMYPEQDWRASSQELGEGEVSARQEVIGQGKDNICTLCETEFDPKGDNGSELPMQVDSNVVITETDSAGWEPAPSQESMHPEQDRGARSSPELGGSEASTRQEVIGKGDIQEMQQSDGPSTLEDSTLCDQLTSTAEQVVEVPQEFRMGSSQLVGLEEQHEAMSQPSDCLDVTAQQVLLPEMKMGEVTENEVPEQPVCNEDVPKSKVASSDIDQVLEKLASEFERQASAEMGVEVHQSVPSI